MLVESSRSIDVDGQRARHRTRARLRIACIAGRARHRAGVSARWRSTSIRCMTDRARSRMATSRGADTRSAAWLQVRAIEFPVVYGGEQGPDLADVAAARRMRDGRRHRAACRPRRIACSCSGFVPGFAYLGPRRPRIAAPRRATPRVRVPAGRWVSPAADRHLSRTSRPADGSSIGRPTRACSTRPARRAWSQPGDRVRFVPIESPDCDAASLAQPDPRPPRARRSR